MNHLVRPLVTAALSGAVLVAASTAMFMAGSSAVSLACAPGETGVTNGCAPFCLPGLMLDTQTGLCVKAPVPTPDPPPPPTLSNSF